MFINMIQVHVWSVLKGERQCHEGEKLFPPTSPAGWVSKKKILHLTQIWHRVFDIPIWISTLHLDDDNDDDYTLEISTRQDEML